MSDTQTFPVYRARIRRNKPDDPIEDWMEYYKVSRIKNKSKTYEWNEVLRHSGRCYRINSGAVYVYSDEIATLFKLSYADEIWHFELFRTCEQPVCVE